MDRGLSEHFCKMVVNFFCLGPVGCFSNDPEYWLGIGGAQMDPSAAEFTVSEKFYAQTVNVGYLLAGVFVLKFFQ